MRRTTLMLLALPFGILPGGVSIAQGDAEAGKELAAQWCARCHDISDEGPFKRTPPSFASIAVYRAPDDIRWRIQFPAEHANMPRLGFVLDPKAVDDLAAFIISLEKPRQ